MLEPKSKEITLNGMRLFLFERRTADIIGFQRWFTDHPEPENDSERFLFNVMQAARIVHDSLKPNYYNTPMWRWIRRLRIRRAILETSLVSNLTSTQLSLLAQEVVKLEGNDGGDVKKKGNLSQPNTHTD